MAIKVLQRYKKRFVYFLVIRGNKKVFQNKEFWRAVG